MSKNFDVLIRAGRDGKLFEVTSVRGEQRAVKPAASEPGTVTHDEITRLVQRLFVLSANGSASPRAVAFCGIEPGDGATWICARVAHAVAARGTNKVCVVDANFRSPALHNRFHVNNRGGLMSALCHHAPIRNQVLQGTGNNLWLLPAGADADPNVLTNSKSLSDRVAELRAEFEFLIFDTPPASLFDDAVVIGRLLDGVVLVVGAHSTHRETARKAKENLQAGHVRLLGTVLNQRTFPIPNTLYRWL